MKWEQMKLQAVLGSVSQGTVSMVITSLSEGTPLSYDVVKFLCAAAEVQLVYSEGRERW